MIEGRITTIMQALKSDLAVTAEKALTAEAVWPGAEFQTAGAKTASGTEAASNVEIFSEDKGSSRNLKKSYKNRHYGNDQKIIFLTDDNHSSGGNMSMDDQRASKRINHEAPLGIENCDLENYSYGRMYNYSPGGVYFESDTPFQPGTRVRIDIEKPKIALEAGHYFAEAK